MTTPITAVQGNNISPITLIDLDLNGNVYYLSSNYKAITHNSNSYTELGAFLNITDLRDELRHSEGDISITLSGIPSEADYLQTVMTEPIKGGNVTVYRAFVDATTQELISGQVFTRMKGVITNFIIDEQLNFLTHENDYSVTVTVAGLTSVLSNMLRGQKTNPDERKRIYSADKSFDRIPILFNTTFDFGKEYTTGGNYGGGPGGGGGNRRRNEQQR
jgi:hypothetical protein